MFFDFVEIGTSDFATFIQEADDSTRGISIDPVASYLNNLPNRQHCIKLNAAISNKDTETTVYYTTPESITKFNLPSDFRGCNSIDRPHPTVVNYLEKVGINIQDVVCSDRIPVFRLRTVFAKYEVSGVFFLKVDTEGHDTAILEDFFIHCPRPLLPHRLLFESNILSENDRIQNLYLRLISLGYDIVKAETGGPSSDSFLKLNINRLRDRKEFFRTSSGYYLEGYPRNYVPEHAPHGNTLEEAQKYCVDLGCGGVTHQYGRFEVRMGNHLSKDKASANIQSWIYL